MRVMVSPFSALTGSLEGSKDAAVPMLSLGKLPPIFTTHDVYSILIR